MSKHQYKTITIKTYYYLNGEYIPFEDNPNNNKTFNNAYLIITKDKEKINNTTFISDLFMIIQNNELAMTKKCEIVDIIETKDNNIILKICEDWG